MSASRLHTDGPSEAVLFTHCVSYRYRAAAG